MEESDSAALKTSKGKLLRAAYDWLKTLFVVFFVVLSFRSFVAEAYVIKGQSMVPTFSEADRLLVSKLSSTEAVGRGDIIVFEHENKRLIKRVIALGGDMVEIRDGVVFVNDEPQEESYVRHDVSNYRLRRIPDGHLFVLGDNRKSSSDSRSWGFVSSSSVLGKAVLRFYPLDEWTVF